MLLFVFVLANMDHLRQKGVRRKEKNKKNTRGSVLGNAINNTLAKFQDLSLLINGIDIWTFVPKNSKDNAMPRNYLVPVYMLDFWGRI